VKQIFETVLKEQSRAFREVILLEYPRENCWALGFITGSAESGIQELTPDDTVNIFLPTTPNPTSGFLLFAPAREVIELEMSVEDAAKLVISAGLVYPDRQSAEAANVTQLRKGADA
jgi:uncharacterized membrane protein